MICAGGVTNGNDLMAAYVRSSGRWPKEVAKLGVDIVEVEERSQFYGKTNGTN